jgi:hypothetical protein
MKKLEAAVIRKFIGWMVGVVAVIAIAIPARVIAVGAADKCVEGQYWVDADGARTDILPAYVLKCVYNNEFPMINRAGECGRPKGLQPDLMIYGPNGSCEGQYCNTGREYGGVAMWPALSVGSPVTVCVNGALYRGKVFEVIPSADTKGILPQTPFKCKTGVCGTLTTAAGIRPHYTVTRFWVNWGGKSALR